MHRRSSASEGTFDECRTRRAHKRVLLPVHDGNEAADRGAGKSRKDPGTLRIQRRVASSEMTANITAEVNYDGASRDDHIAQPLVL